MKNNRFFIISILITTISILATACSGSGIAAGPETPPAAIVSAQPAHDNPAQPTEPAAPTEAALGTAWPQALSLQQAMTACEDLETGQVCLGSGQIELTQSGQTTTLPLLEQPGDRADLEAVQSLRVLAGSADNWGIAILSVPGGPAADDPCLQLILLGQAELTRVEPEVSTSPGLTFSSSEPGEPDPAGNLPEAAPENALPGFTLTSQPAADTAERLPGGLLVLTPAGYEELMSIRINSADLTLGSTAFVQAQPGGAQAVAMLEGTGLVEAAGGSGFAAGGTQVSVPLDASGAASAPPGETTVIDPRALAIAEAVAQYGLPQIDPRAQAISEAIAQYGQPPIDPRAKAISDAIDQYGTQVTPDTRAQILANAIAQYPKMAARRLIQKLNHSIDRCSDPQNPQPSYVYNVLYWHNVIAGITDPEIRAALAAGGAAKAEARVRKCLSFELDFNSTAEVITPQLSYKIQLLAKALKVEFNADGSLNLKDQKPLQHLVYEVNGGEVPCSRELVAPDGDFRITDGSLKINYESLRLVLDVWPNDPQELVRYGCGYSQPEVALSWAPLFYFTNKDKVQGDAYRITDWRNVETELFAESISVGTLPIDTGQATVTSYLVLVHTPQP